jgi:hypothetical protein
MSDPPGVCGFLFRSERKNSMARKVRKTVRLGFGSWVGFSLDGKPRQGTVTSIDGDNITVRVGGTTDEVTLTRRSVEVLL